MVAVFFQKLLEGLDGAGVEPRCPALRLADLGAGLFEGLLLEVVPFEQFPLFFRQLGDGGADPELHLLELEALVGGQVVVVAELEPLAAFEAGSEDHRQAADGTGNFPHIVVDGASAAALIAIREVAGVGVGALGGAGGPRFGALEDPHLAEAVEDRALDAVVGKGEEVGAHLGVEALRGFEEADLPQATSSSISSCELNCLRTWAARLRTYGPYFSRIVFSSSPRPTVPFLTRPWSRGDRAPD